MKKLLISILCLIFLTACNDSKIANQVNTEQKSVPIVSETKAISVLDLNSKDFISSPNDIEIRITAIRQTSPKSNSNTREGEAEYATYSKLKKDFEETLKNKKITDWTCTYTKTPTDLVRELGNISSMEFKESSFDCSGILINIEDLQKMHTASRTSIMNGEVGYAAQEYKIKIKEDNARQIEKIYLNDKIKFSGEIESCSISWLSSKVNYTCNINGIASMYK